MRQNLPAARRGSALANDRTKHDPDEFPEIIGGPPVDPPDIERREQPRFPIPYTFRLTPLDGNGHPLEEQATTVIGKNLSPANIGFSHDRPLSGRRAVISLDHPTIGRFAVEVEIIWTRRTAIGIYESGGRLIRTVEGHLVRPPG